MALAIASAGRLKAEVRLRQSIDKFQSVLSKEQKAAFSAGRDLAAQSFPGMRDVMNITAEIDRQARLGHGAGRRCFGTRMTKVLESVQQFVSVGDVLIGGSQNLIACGVWSVVRLALIATSRFATSLEKLSNLFMVVGRSSPRYLDMVALHPRSKELRQFGIEYQITIVDLCHYMMVFANQSKVEQLKGLFKELDVSTYQTSLLKWSDAIKEQLSLEEAKENSQFRTKFTQTSALEAFRRKVDQNSKLLDACSKFDYQSAWKQTRKCGNATWFVNDEGYKRWKTSQDQQLILVAGKLGSGKTVTLANILDDVLLDVDHSIVTYFFCRADTFESRQARTVLGCIARQILQSLSPGDVKYEEPMLSSDLAVADLEKLISRNISTSKSLFIVIDGLDECSYESRKSVLDCLRILQPSGDLRICLSYRLVADSGIQEELTSALGKGFSLSMPEENPDIANFIESELEACIESGKLALRDPQIILEIAQVLESEAQGMFLWVVLQIETICQQKTDGKIREALRHLPKSLPDTFARILSLAENVAPDYRERMFQILIAAVRPLTKEELREALSVRPYESEWDVSNIVNDIQTILTAGSSLLIVDEEHDTIHFVHSSVIQFMLSNMGSKHNFIIDQSVANLEMAKIVVTYLSYKQTSREIGNVRNLPSISDKKFFDGIISSTSPTISSRLVRSTALHLLRSRKDASIDVGKALSNLKPIISKQVQLGSFHHYAQNTWLDHTLSVESEFESEDKLLKIIRVLLDRDGFPPADELPQRCKFAPIWVPRWLPRKDDRITQRALQLSNLPLLRVMIRKSLRNIVVVFSNAKRLIDNKADHLDLNIRICTKLFCLFGLTKNFKACNKIFELAPFSTAALLNTIPALASNGFAIAVTLVYAQAKEGYGRHKLRSAIVGYVKRSSFPSKKRVLKVVTYDHLANHVYIRSQTAQNKTSRWRWVDNRGKSIGESPFLGFDETDICDIHPEDIFSTGNVFRTCCDEHSGLLIGETRLCACCVPSQYRQFIDHLGDFEAREDRPRFTAEKIHWGLDRPVLPNSESRIRPRIIVKEKNGSRTVRYHPSLHMMKRAEPLLEP